MSSYSSSYFFYFQINSPLLRISVGIPQYSIASPLLPSVYFSSYLILSIPSLSMTTFMQITPKLHDSPD